MKRAKNAWALVLLLLCGVVLGGFIGTMTEDVSWLRWLSYGRSFGFTSPLLLDLGVIAVTFGLTIQITMASIIGVIIAIFIYRFI